MVEKQTDKSKTSLRELLQRTTATTPSLLHGGLIYSTRATRSTPSIHYYESGLLVHDIRTGLSDTNTVHKEFKSGFHPEALR